MTETSEAKAAVNMADDQSKDPNALFNYVRRELVCPICYENYDQLALKPVSLVPCGHSVCSKCVDKLERKTCPTCKEPFSIHIFNWAVIGLLPKPTVDEIKSQVKRSIEENAGLINELDRLSKLTCFESARKEIVDKYAELVSDLQVQKRELLNRVSTIEMKCGVKNELVAKVQKDMKQFQSELSQTSEVSECRLSSMIKILQLDSEQLQESAKNLKRITIEPPVLRFRPQSQRWLNLIGDLACELEAQEPATMADRRRARIPDIINQAREASSQYRLNSFLRSSIHSPTSFNNIRRRTNEILNESPYTVFGPSEFIQSRNRFLESPVLSRRDYGAPADPLWQ